MAPDPVLAPSDVSVPWGGRGAAVGLLADYWAITKPDVNVLIAIATAAGFCLALPAAASPFPWMRFVPTLLGTVLVSGGAAALNQWMEHPFDAKMRRTARRAVAAGRLDPDRALLFGTSVALAGTACLLAAAVAASLLALATLVIYLALYTPLKRRTPLCTLVGACAGAAPPLIGWTAARGHLDPGAWVIFAILFSWQLPHVMAIAWMYRDDYDRAGYLVLPATHRRTAFVAAQTLLPFAALLPASLLRVGSDDVNHWYSIAALLLGLGFLSAAVWFVRVKSGTTARRLLFASIVYLPALLALMVIFE